MKKISHGILIIGVFIMCISIHYNPEKYTKAFGGQNAVDVTSDGVEITASPEETAGEIQSIVTVLNGPIKNFCEGTMTNATQFINDTWMSMLNGTGYVKENKSFVDKAIEGIKNLFARTSSDEKSLTGSYDTVTLEKVVDGDTIVVNINGSSEKVRFIGIDTPESVHADESKNNIYGQMASDYTKELLSGVTTLYLTYDEEKTDQYDRTLAYVWLSEPDTVEEKEIENQMLNAVLVKNGYAYNKVYMPNTKYANLFESLRKDAQDASTGLWQYPEFAALWEK